MTLCIVTLQATWGKLAITQDNNGIVVFTLEASNDIANEFTFKAYASYEASNRLKPYLKVQKLKIITKPGVALSSDDLNEFVVWLKKKTTSLI